MSAYIAIDFDGTIVEHRYPKIGKPIPQAIETIKLLQKKHKIILLTMRGGELLDEAVRYLKNNGIKLFGINENITQKDWTSSKKVHAHIYIDDAALGCPLTLDSENKKCANWDWIKLYLQNMELL